MRGTSFFRLAGPLLACACAGALVAAVPAAAQGSYSPYNETAAAALARYVRALADDPKDFNSLVGAGRAALELGDALAAAGFFARADEVNPRSPAPQAGMGAVQVANGNPQAAMAYFTRAEQLGATQTMLGCDRGLAYDLLGQQARAQADYRAALNSADAEEARRRLALSLAISGDKSGALAAIAPLAARGDATTNRVRAFVLALTGNTAAAKMAIDAAMPGTWSRVAPFVQRLASLPAGEKAAAVNLGIFPDSSEPAYAYADPVRTAPSSLQMAGSVSTDRLQDVDALLSAPSAPQADQPVWQQPALQPQAQPVQIAYAAPPRPATVERTPAVTKPKIWLQLASGRNSDALSQQFDRLKSNHEAVFKGITGFLVQASDRARLVIGPFRGSSDADILAEDLHTLGIDAFRWTNSDSDRIVPIAGE
jgi:Flp pilus assembly protein TadD